MFHSIRTGIVVLSLALLPTVGALADEGVSRINGAIRVAAGRSTGDLETVNGSIRLGDNAVAEDVSTVNGMIELGEAARAESVNSVNGRILLSERAEVQGDVTAVNGTLELAKASSVGGDLGNVAGDIRIEAAHVGGRIQTVNGDIEIGADSRVDGGILIEKSEGWFSTNPNDPPLIVIGPRAVVGGELVFEREVNLYVSDSATVGAIRGATPKRFSGDHP